MRRVLLGAVILAPLAACTYVNERQPYARPGYAQPGYGYGSTVAPSPIPGYRDGSYEAERQAYEYGRRDGAAGNRFWR
jgi:hypothetical protein